MRSIPLQKFKKGYKRHAAALGYRQISARPWQIHDVRGTLQHMLQKLNKAKGLPAAMLARDGFILAVLWQTSSRGCNAGSWRLDNVKLPTGDASCIVRPVHRKIVCTERQLKRCPTVQANLPSPTCSPSWACL